MPIQILFYATVLLVVILGVVLAFVVSSYQKLVEKHAALKARSKHLKEVSGEEKAAFAEELGKISGEEAGEYQEILENVKNQARATLEEISKSTREASVAEVKGMSSFFKTKVDEEYTKIQSELEKYKKDRLKEIDENKNQIIKDMSTKVLGEAIDTDKHQELIMKALEEAKKENVL